MPDVSGSYQLLDAGQFKKLEKVGPYVLIRPSPQAVWNRSTPKIWDNADAEYLRQKDGSGNWHLRKKKGLATLDSCHISYGEARFFIQLTSFGHLGLFPEQKNNWHLIKKVTSFLSEKKKVNVLNLFGYSGGASIAALMGGGTVTHVDASPASVNWAKENVIANGCQHQSIRWICEDVRKFVSKEVKRENKYHGVILDPPTFGRGKKGEVWKIERDLPDLLRQIRKIMTSRNSFILLSAHTPGYGQITLQNLLLDSFKEFRVYDSAEMTVTYHKKNRQLPSGSSCFVVNFDDHL